MKETKERIIVKALQYFVENEYQSVSLNAIAEGIGITKGGIYHYFGSKDELFMECMFTVFRNVQEFSAGSLREDSNLEEILTAMFSFDAIFKMMKDVLNIGVHNYHNFYYLMFMGIKKFPKVKEMINDIYAAMQQELTALFINLKSQGVIKKEIDCKILAFELIAMIEGSLLVSGFTHGTDLSEVGRNFVQSTMERVCV